MKDNFDLYEYQDTLKSKLRENSLTGRDASTKVIAYLRDSIYPKLNDEELNTFTIDIADHLDLTVPAYRLPESEDDELDEGELPRQLTTSLDDLTYDIIDDMFDGSVMAPNPDDSNMQIQDDEDLSSWKIRTKSRYGNINLRLDSEASSPWERIKVLDDKFIDDKNTYIDNKAQALKDGL
ncbi:hypothetical protein N9145_03585 [bacterium]|nr:hypothetical protein [bacterium]